jgi:hypothetical protein
MNELYDILETCLNELDQGASIESVLTRYPAHADELRPILEASVDARNIAVPEPASDIVRRNRARVLQHAAQMREAKAQSSRRLWSVPLRRALVSLVVIGLLFISSTQLVSAASTTLPGDNLYPVKRTWEDVLILFTFNTQSRQTLEVEHENERLTELNEIFAQKRSVQVDFSGQVTRQNGDLWLVAGIPVAVSPETVFSSQPVAIGDAIHVVGVTQNDGAVLAQQIDLLPAGVPLPTINDDDAVEQEHSGEPNQAGEDHSGKGSATEAPKIEVTGTSEPESNSDSGSSSSTEIEPKDETVKGTVESINGNIVVVNGQIMNVSSAEVSGTPKVGAAVKVEGYYDPNGLFIVTKIEYESSTSNDSGSSKSGSDSGDSKNKDSGSNDSGGGSTDGGGSDDGGTSGGGGSDDGGGSSNP